MNICKYRTGFYKCKRTVTSKHNNLPNTYFSNLRLT